MAEDDGAAAAPGEHLVEELRWVHDVIRRDLKTVRQLAVQTLAGAPPGDVRERIAELQTSGPLWRLKVNCLYYCRFVHGHHTNEDVNIFPALRAADPAMEPVVDRLEHDHRIVAVQLDEIIEASDVLVEEDTVPYRRRLTTALEGLAEHLLAHLDYEEESIADTLRQWSRWPMAGHHGA